MRLKAKGPWVVGLKHPGTAQADTQPGNLQLVHAQPSAPTPSPPHIRWVMPPRQPTLLKLRKLPFNGHMGDRGPERESNWPRATQQRGMGSQAARPPPLFPPPLLYGQREAWRVFKGTWP